MTSRKDFLSITLLFNIFLNVNCEDVTALKPPTGCPVGYRPFKENCYKIYSNLVEGVSYLDFEGAKSYCQNKGSNLASIHSKEEHDFVTAYLGELPENNWVYIGLQKIIRFHKTTYTWVDGSEDRNFRNFLLEQPDGGDQEGCISMISEDNFPGKWVDIRCDAKLGFVCKTKRIGGIHHAPFQQDENCPKGYSRYLDKCYRLEHSEVDFWTAERKCVNEYDGHLASIENGYHEAFLTSLITDVNKNFWIGFSDHLNDFMKGKFAWTDGSDVHHMNWINGQPESRSGDRCIAHTANGWTVKDCGENLAFVCVKQPNLDVIYIGTCPEGWVDVLNQYCYYVETNKAVPYESAISQCARKAPDGTLAMFESDHDLQLLRPALSKYGTQYFAIGIKRYQTYTYSSRFKFLNGKPTNYLPWNYLWVFPENLPKKSCVQLRNRNMRYETRDCNEAAHYICQTNKIIHLKRNKDEVMGHRVREESRQEGNSSSPEAAALFGVGVVLAALGIILTAHYVYRRLRKPQYEKPTSQKFQIEIEAD